jgi:uncharacterized protein (DUF1697 family)
MSKKYLALLRGINVGGNNIIKMVALKGCFEGLGFSDVTTFIQSGNVIFSSEEKDVVVLCGKIEKALSDEFGYKACVVLMTDKALKDAVKLAPKGFGQESTVYRYDVVFLKQPLTARRAIKDVPLKEGVDTVHAGKNVLYFSRRISQAAQSKLSKMIRLPIYKSMTIRNWNTTTRLLHLME